MAFDQNQLGPLQAGFGVCWQCFRFNSLTEKDYQLHTFFSRLYLTLCRMYRNCAAQWIYEADWEQPCSVSLAHEKFIQATPTLKPQWVWFLIEILKHAKATVFLSFFPPGRDSGSSQGGRGGGGGSMEPKKPMELELDLPLGVFSSLIRTQLPARHIMVLT